MPNRKLAIQTLGVGRHGAGSSGLGLKVLGKTETKVATPTTLQA